MSIDQPAGTLPIRPGIEALAGKVVLPLATGGTIAHVLDYALQPVLVSLGAQHIVNGLFVLDKAIVATEHGVTLDAEVDSASSRSSMTLLPASRGASSPSAPRDEPSAPSSLGVQIRARGGRQVRHANDRPAEA